jgi:iron complex transport system substrate-binding protein
MTNDELFNDEIMTNDELGNWELGIGNWKLFPHSGFVIRILIVILVILSLFSFPSLAATPQRLISSMPSITEMLFALDLDDRIVGVTTNCNYPPQALNKEKVGGFFLNLEKVVSLKPDLIVMFTGAQDRDIKKFKDFGLPVYEVNVKSVEEVMDTLLDLGKITGKQKQAEMVVEQMRRRIENISALNPSLLDVLKFWETENTKHKALVMVGYNPLIVAGPATFVDDILKVSGLENVAEEAKAAYPQYSFEKLLTENPKYIIIPQGVVTKEQIEKDGRWQSLEAVRKGRILFINPDILSRPGPRVVEAIVTIVRFVHDQP